MIRNVFVFLLVCFYSVLDAQVYMPDGKTYYIQSAQTYGKSNKGYWDFPGTNPTYSKGQNLKVWAFENRPDRKFKFQYAGFINGIYYFTIAPEYTKRRGVIDVSGGKSADGTNIQVWDRNNTSSQKYYFKHVGNGRWKIYNQNGKIVCLQGKSSENGTNIHLWHDHTLPTTEWVFIDAETNVAYNPEVKPFGKVIDAITGKPIQDATITVYNTNIVNIQPNTKHTDFNGKFVFDVIDGIKYGYRIVISAPGYGSKYVDGHTNYTCVYTTYKLTPEGDNTLLTNGPLGDWLYKNSNGELYYEYGEVLHKNKEFFNTVRFEGAAEQLNLVRQEMGVTDRQALTDEEIFEQLKKVWNFWCVSTKSFMGNNVEPIVKEARKYEEDESKVRGQWPSIQRYAQCYNKYGFIPVGNCTSNTLAFANLLTLTGIPNEKLAVEVMNPLTQANGEHWSVIIKLKGKWFWVDPQSTYIKLTTLDDFTSFPKARNMAYDKPYKVYPFPGNSMTKVPLCSYE